MIIACDLDGVFADFNTPYIALVKEITGKNLFPVGYDASQITTWSYPESFGYTNEEISKVWDHIGESRNFWRRLEPLQGARSLLRTICDLMYENPVYFVTSRPGKYAKPQTEQWITANWRYLDDFPTVLISSQKGECCHALKADIYIDDKTENCIDVVSKSPKTQCYMLAQPWNRAVPGCIRIDSLEPFERLIISAQ